MKYQPDQLEAFPRADNEWPDREALQWRFERFKTAP
jgi:hypothetical protein